MVSEPVALHDTSPVPKGRSKQSGAAKCAQLRKKCRAMATLQLDQLNEVLGRNEYKTVWEET